MNDLLDWRIGSRDIGRDGRAVNLAATPAELDRVAAALDLAACRSLAFSGHVRPLAGSRYLVEGVLTADVAQRCVVTLDPVDAVVREKVAVEFWPPEDVEAGPSTSFDALSGDDPEPIENGSVSLGRLAYELLAAGLDPYPRKPGAEIDGQYLPGADPDAHGSKPFAGLACLKPAGEPGAEPER